MRTPSWLTRTQVRRRTLPGTAARHGVASALIVAGLALAANVVYFVHGSLETFPTAERQEAARLATGAIAVLLVAVEIGLWLLFRRLGSAPSEAHRHHR